MMGRLTPWPDAADAAQAENRLLAMKNGARFLIAEKAQQDLFFKVLDASGDDLGGGYSFIETPLGLIIEYRAPYSARIRKSDQRRAVKRYYNPSGLAQNENALHAAIRRACKANALTMPQLQRKIRALQGVDPAPLLDHMVNEGVLCCEEREHSRKKTTSKFYKLVDKHPRITP